MLFGNRSCEREDRLAPSAPEIRYPDPVLEALDKFGDEREDVVEEPGECRLVALLGHCLVEAAEPLVGHTAALAEAAHDVVLDLAEHRDPLRGHRDVVRRGGARQPRCVLGREQIGLAVRVEQDDASGRHRTKPFAHIALLEPGSFGERLARQWACVRQGVEQSCPVPDGHHERCCGPIQPACQLLRKGLGAFRVDPHSAHSSILLRLRTN